MRKHEDRQVWAGHFICPPCATWRPWILWSPHSHEAQQEMLHETLPLKWVWREAPHCQERKELPTSQWKEPEDSGRLLLEDLSVSYICCLWTIITIASFKLVTTLSFMLKTACRKVEPKLCCNWTSWLHYAPLHLLYFVTGGLITMASAPSSEATRTWAVPRGGTGGRDRSDRPRGHIANLTKTRGPRKRPKIVGIGKSGFNSSSYAEFSQEHDQHFIFDVWWPHDE